MNLKKGGVSVAISPPQVYLQARNDSWAQKSSIRYWCASCKRKSHGHLGGDETFFCFPRSRQEPAGTGVIQLVVSRFSRAHTSCCIPPKPKIFIQATSLAVVSQAHCDVHHPRNDRWAQKKTCKIWACMVKYKQSWSPRW